MSNRNAISSEMSEPTTQVTPVIPNTDMNESSEINESTELNESNDMSEDVDTPEVLDQAQPSEELKRQPKERVLNVVDMRKYTEQIWLAGLGAFSKAEEEGFKFFESLVKIGEELESKATTVASEVYVNVVDSVAGKISSTAHATREHLDDVVDHTTSKIGNSSKSSEQLVSVIENIHVKIDNLLKEVEALKK